MVYVAFPESLKPYIQKVLTYIIITFNKTHWVSSLEKKHTFFCTYIVGYLS